MWRTTFLIVGLGGVLAGCSLGGGSARAPEHGYLQGRVVTYGVSCALPTNERCGTIPYRGEIVLCRQKGQIGLCPGAHVDASGRYRIRLAPGRYYLVSAPAKRNLVAVKPRWVEVGGGQTRTVNIVGGNEIKMSREPTTAQGDCFPVCSGSQS